MLRGKQEVRAERHPKFLWWLYGSPSNSQGGEEGNAGGDGGDRVFHSDQLRGRWWTPRVWRSRCSVDLYMVILHCFSFKTKLDWYKQFFILIYSISMMKKQWNGKMGRVSIKENNSWEPPNMGSSVLHVNSMKAFRKAQMIGLIQKMHLLETERWVIEVNDILHSTDVTFTKPNIAECHTIWIIYISDRFIAFKDENGCNLKQRLLILSSTLFLSSQCRPCKSWWGCSLQVHNKHGIYV